MARMKYFCAGISQKWVFAVLAFFAVFCVFSMRMTLPLTIPKMVKSNMHKQHNDVTCPGPNVTTSKASPNNMRNSRRSVTYKWSEYTQGIILSSFYWGYVVSHVPGGILSERYGGKHVLGLGTLATAVLTILTPLSISWAGSTGLIILRLVMGLCEGMTQPALGYLMAQWIPANERSKITSFVFMGGALGIMLISLSMGTIMRALGWQGVYYIFGGLGVLWFIPWLLLGYNNPREHPFIGEAEARKLNAKLQEHTHDDAPPVPWRHLLTSGPFWALVIATVGWEWGGVVLISDLPKYTMNVLKMTVDENGILYAAKHTVVLVCTFFFSWLSDWVVKTEYISRTNARKLSATVGMTGSGIFILLSSYVGCDKILYIVVSCFIMAAKSAGFPGLKSNVLDLSPNYAGTVMAISHGLAGLCGIAGPYLVGVLVPNETLNEWRLIFWIMFIIMSSTNAVFVIFGSGEVQEWNDPNFDRKRKNDKSTELKEAETLLE